MKNAFLSSLDILVSWIIKYWSETESNFGFLNFDSFWGSLKVLDIRESMYGWYSLLSGLAFKKVAKHLFLG